MRVKAFFNKLPFFILCSACSILFIVLVCLAGIWFSEYRTQAGISPPRSDGKPSGLRNNIAREDFPDLLNHLILDPEHAADSFVLKKGEEHLTVKSTIDPAFQKYIFRLLQRSKTQQAAVLVLNSTDGRILAMVSYDKAGSNRDLCLKAEFPAASLFKIVAAAAAFENAGYWPNKEVYYRGKSHTLYRSQLKQKTGRYTVKTSFRRAFASSINPVFGKLGIYELGQDVLDNYADKFLFNRQIPFDLPVEMSKIQVPDDHFGLAEVASGFNKETLISPLHAALLASVPANNGVMVAPWLIEHICDESGGFLYQRRPTMLACPINSRAASNLRALMRDTVRYGTCGRSFSRLGRKKAFRSIELGAKTGTINDKSDRFKYDWLAAYAISKDRLKSICVAVLGVHGEKLGIRSNELGRYIIDYYITS